MSFTGFTDTDFDVFKIDGLEARMDALITHIRPKLNFLGEHFAPTLSVFTGDEMFAHVAKHARRTTNPPNDTWVAFSSNKRGYKMLPHFQIGLWETHLFIWYAIIYEAPNKAEFGRVFEKNASGIYSTTPNHFVWSLDHMKPTATPHQQLTEDELLSMFHRLQTVKKAELLCGVHIPREEATKLSGEEFLNIVHSTFKQLAPLYNMTK